jgi:hypothetical protein
MMALRSIFVTGAMVAGLAPLSSCGAQTGTTGGCYTGGPAETLWTPPSRNATDLPIDLDVSGQSGGDISSIDVVRDRGTIGIRGQEIHLTVHERIQYPGRLVVYQAVGYPDSADVLHVVWFYCDAGALTSVYYESTSAPGIFANAIGQCVERGLNGLATPFISDFPALNLRVPHLSCGFSVSTPQQTGPGTLQLSGKEPGLVADASGQVRTALPFELIDCRNGTCGSGQWFEMHILLWDPDAGPFLGYGIMYFRTLNEGKSGHGANMGYQFSLSPIGRRLLMTDYPDATWSFD